MDILISGASIAGPSLAYWLRRFGFRPTVVERAPALREGGQAVDFRGTAHLSVLTRMGILDEIRRQQTPRADLRFVDETGTQRAKLPADFAGGEVEILRGDLSRILHDITQDTEYVFGDWITSLDETADGVEVTFQHGAPRRFDLVIGADGMHSGVRKLAFGKGFRHFLGYYLASFSAPGDDDHVMCNVPGRMASPGLFVFQSGQLAYDRGDIAQQKEIVAAAYTGMGWRAPELVEAMRAAGDFYFDSISHVRMDHFTRGRVALVGDAGYGATLGGTGTGLAVVSSYVLAGELAAAQGDHRIAFARYEEKIKPYAKGCQGNAGPFLAPGSRAKIWQRNQAFKMFNLRPMAGLFARMDMKVANAITLEDYERPRQAA